MVNLKHTVKIIEDNFSTICNLYDFLKSSSGETVYPLVAYQQVKDFFTEILENSELSNELKVEEVVEDENGLEEG